MAVTNQVVAPAADQLAEQPRVVAVQKSDSPAGQLQLAASLVADGLPAHRLAQLVPVVVAVSEHEMGWPGGQQPHHVDRADVAAMNHLLHLAAFQHRHGLAQ